IHRDPGDLPTPYRRWPRLGGSRAEAARYCRRAGPSPMKPLFVGWSGRSALPHLGFLALLLFALVAGFVVLAFSLRVTVDDPGGGDFSGDKDITGVLIADPYPMIVTDKDQHTVILSGGGKRGVQAEARALDGKHVRATGGGVKRGDRDLLL